MWVTSYNLSGMVPQGYGLVVEFISAEICFPIVFAVLLTILYYSYYFHIMKRCFRFLAAKRQAQSARSTAVRKVEMASDINKFQRF